MMGEHATNRREYNNEQRETEDLNTHARDGRQAGTQLGLIRPDNIGKKQN